MQHCLFNVTRTRRSENYRRAICSRQKKGNRLRLKGGTEGVILSRGTRKTPANLILDPQGSSTDSQWGCGGLRRNFFAEPAAKTTTGLTAQLKAQSALQFVHYLPGDSDVARWAKLSLTTIPTVSSPRDNAANPRTRRVSPTHHLSRDQSIYLWPSSYFIDIHFRVPPISL